VKREDWREILSQRDWRRLLPYAPVAAVIVVIVAALGTDLAFGGPSKPKVDNAAPPPEVARATIAAAPVSPTPYVPPPTATPTAAPTALPEFIAQSRDKTRMDDLAKIAGALEQYRKQEGEYPSNGGAIQTMCTYQEFDAGCKLKDVLDPLPEDPLGDPAKNGYWYSSDGKKFTLIAAVDSPANATPDKCDERFSQHTAKTNLYCVKGSS
jgi:hypothetical protein